MYWRIHSNVLLVRIASGLRILIQMCFGWSSHSNDARFIRMPYLSCFFFLFLGSFIFIWLCSITPQMSCFLSLIQISHGILEKKYFLYFSSLNGLRDNKNIANFCHFWASIIHQTLHGHNLRNSLITNTFLYVRSWKKAEFMNLKQAGDMFVA